MYLEHAADGGVNSLDNTVDPLGAALLDVKGLHAHLHAGRLGTDQRVLHLLLGRDELPGTLARVVGDGEERALCHEPPVLVHLLGRDPRARCIAGARCPRTPAGRPRGTWAHGGSRRAAPRLCGP